MIERKKAYSLLYVDLDGTFLKTDILWEQLIILLRSPIKFIGALFSIFRGKSACKAYCLTNAGIPDISILPMEY